MSQFVIKSFCGAKLVYGCYVAFVLLLGYDVLGSLVFLACSEDSTTSRQTILEIFFFGSKKSDGQRIECLIFLSLSIVGVLSDCVLFVALIWKNTCLLSFVLVLIIGNLTATLVRTVFIQCETNTIYPIEIATNCASFAIWFYLILIINSYRVQLIKAQTPHASSATPSHGRVIYKPRSKKTTSSTTGETQTSLTHLKPISKQSSTEIKTHDH